MSHPILLGLAAAAFLILIAIVALRRLPPLAPQNLWPEDDSPNGDPFPPHLSDLHVREAAEKAYGNGRVADDGEHYSEGAVQQAVSRPIDYRVDVLHDLWRGQVSKAGIMQLLRGGHDIGRFTAKRARMALDAMEVGKPMLDRVHALLDEREEEDVSVSILHQGVGVYRAILMRGGKRGTARVTDSMGQNQFVSAIIEASEKLRPPLEGSFLGAAGGPSGIFEQGQLSAKGEDGGEG